MQPRTYRPAKFVRERLDRIRDHLQAARADQPQTHTDAITFATWYVDELLRSGRLTQADLQRGKAEVTL